MNLSMEPLDDDELDELDQFLLYRGEVESDDTYVEGLDEGILTLSELDGFLTAVVSGPEAITPSHWLPVVWGDVEPKWKSPQEFERIFTLLIRHMNGIVDTLLYSANSFDPIFMESEIEGKTHTIVHEWCTGYIRGIGLAQEQWESGSDEMLGLLSPIDIFTNEWGWKILEKLNEQEHESLKQEIGPAARAIYSYWMARRTSNAAPFVRDAPKAGRN